MYSIHRNSYLHNYYKDVNPRLINRSVQRAIDFLDCNDRTLVQPEPLPSEQPGASEEALPYVCEEDVPYLGDITEDGYPEAMPTELQPQVSIEKPASSRPTTHEVAFRQVKRAFPALIDEHDLEPPLNRMTSEQPNIPVQYVDATRRPLGFGCVAMRKLRRELHHKHEEVVIAAIESICDIVHDPERGYEAINLKIVNRLVDMIAHENAAIREKTCKTLTVLAGLAAGKEAIVDNPFLLENIAICVEDSHPEVRMHAASMLEMIARFWKGMTVQIVSWTQKE
ncbi:unnamed protein product [Acanthoscelides obtectus]|uniref:Uncharacterized protein n=1 Tax=Acanthoscelides obtectus TaxID=200917 RepID=A0A9P0LDK2_ACAOB|nr:unnamed protein product [Acanthoscelides obtectus]CAK1632948.1 Radial spoke head 14 homolog [Acanthoscelides obtectus]